MVTLSAMNIFAQKGETDYITNVNELTGVKLKLED